MMKKLIASLVLIAICGQVSVFAQSNAHIVANYKKKASAVVEDFRNSLAKSASHAQESVVEEGGESGDLSPYTYKLSAPGVYYSSVMSDKLALDYELPGSEEATVKSSGMDYRDALNSSISDVLFNAYALNPSNFSYHDKQIEKETVVAPAEVAGAKAEDLNVIYNNVQEIQDVTDVVDGVDVDLAVEKPNFWTTSGKFKLQFTQNYFSENWYKGGNNNVTMLSNLVLEANYNDQNRIQWDNKLDLRLGFVTTTSDSCHNFLSNNDKIYLFSKLGVKAAKSWNYTLSLEANTQFLPGYKSNDRRRYSDFIAPLDVFVSLGMDFKPALKNGNQLSVELLPFSYKMRYIGVDDENIHMAYNLPHTNFRQDFGSRVVVNSTLKLVKDLTWKCRFYYFTSYEYAEAEMENVLSFQFNKYIATEINTLWRFDDNRSKKYFDRNLGYFQFKEYFTLGLTYDF